MADYATRQTDKELKDLERRLKKEYEQAAREVNEKLDDYLRRFRIKDETWAQWVSEGQKTPEEYKAWRTQQIMVGERWKRMQESLANDYHNANKLARDMIKDHAIDVFTEHLNFASYTIDAQTGASISDFTIYSRDAVERLLKDNPDMLPPPGEAVSQRIKEGKDVRWNKQQIQSVMTQGILQGESIPKLAKRLAREVGEKNYKAAVRNARTMNTGARNAGRELSFTKAQDMGVELDVVWMSAMDSRVRRSHVHMDGERKSPGGTYSNGLRFPGDPHGHPAEVYNCRCTEIGCVKGVSFDQSVRISDRGEGYEAWKKRMEEEGSTSQDILHQEKVGNAIRQSYINEYRRGGKGFSYSEKSGIMSSRGRGDLRSVNLSIEQRNNIKGKPNAISLFDVGLNKRQQKILNELPEYDSRKEFDKNAVNMSDLSALTAVTGDEFAMFTKGNKRLVIRGNDERVGIYVDDAKELAKTGYKWSGHTHPGDDDVCLFPSPGDIDVLREFSQKESVIYNSIGHFETFGKGET